MFTESNYIMWYDTVLGFGNNDRKEKLYKYFGSAEDIWRSDEDEIRESGILTTSQVDRLMYGKKKYDIAKLVNELYSKEIKYYSRYDEKFPQKLLDLPGDIPMGVYIKGEMPENEHFVGIVGSRRCTEYGALCCRRLAKKLAENGICIVSGMAMGTDTMAHRGCLEAGEKTIAVFGTGADKCYPAHNSELMGRILSNGCVMSEFPLGTEAMPQNFPYRNRIISAMSDAVVVIEAAEKSGSAITANYAMEQNKPIFALPGNITSRLSKGTNELIRTGVATLLSDEKDILVSLGITGDNDNKKEKKNKKYKKTLETDEKLVYDCIYCEPITVDEISVKTGIDVSSLQYILTMLELQGYVTKLAGTKYIRED
jgi:DNA processing protein